MSRIAPPSSQAEREDIAREIFAAECRRQGLDEVANTIERREDEARDGPPAAIAAMLAFSARENADDRTPALVEAAVAEAADLLAELIGTEKSRNFYGIHGSLVAKLRTVRATLTRRPTPSQEASNVG